MNNILDEIYAEVDLFRPDTFRAALDKAYIAAVKDCIGRCEMRANSLPHDQCGIARLCARDLRSTISGA